MSDKQQEQNENQDKPFSPGRTIVVRGEIEVTIRKSLTKDGGDVVAPTELVVAVSIDDETKEGIVILSSGRVKRLLRLLNLKDV